MGEEVGALLVVQRVKALESAGEWQSIRAIGDALIVACATVEERARVHAALSFAFTRTATGADDWRKALDHAGACYRLASTGSTLSAWALSNLASINVNMGRAAHAKRFTLAFLAVVHNHPSLSHVIPHAIRDLAHVHYQERHFESARRLFRRALALFESAGDVEQASRTRLNLAWTLVRENRADDARRALPGDEVPASMAHLRDSALAAVLHAEGDYETAIRVGRRALAAKRLPCDYVDAAETALIIARACQKMNEISDATASLLKVYLLAALQAYSVYALIVLTLRAKGGEYSDQSASRCSGRVVARCAFTSTVG